MTIVYVQPDNFFVSSQTNELCHIVRGFSFVLFTSKQCVFCKDIEPVFRNLSNHIDGCTFIEMDVDQQRQKIRTIAAGSTTPINYVPYLLFYINGRPTARYVPEEQAPQLNFEQMKQFLITQSKSKGNVNSTRSTLYSPAIPKYSLGKPICTNKNVCYLGYDHAYKKK